MNHAYASSERRCLIKICLHLLSNWQGAIHAQTLKQVAFLWEISSQKCRLKYLTLQNPYSRIQHTQKSLSPEKQESKFPPQPSLSIASPWESMENHVEILKWFVSENNFLKSSQKQCLFYITQVISPVYPLKIEWWISW